jgi:hypothetical protein
MFRKLDEQVQYLYKHIGRCPFYTHCSITTHLHLLETPRSIIIIMSAPPSLLARYRQLAPSASVRVSPLCLGAMTFGDAGAAIQGKTTVAESTAILDAFYKAGGNFIDTANG